MSNNDRNILMPHDTVIFENILMSNFDRNIPMSGV